MAETLEQELDQELEDSPQDELEHQEVEETQEETSEADQPVQEEPETTETLDTEIRNYAQQIGMSDADINRLYEVGGQDAVWSAVSTAARLAQNMNQPGGGERQPATSETQAPASESPTFAELDLSDLDDDDPTRAKFEQFHKSAKEAFEFQQKELLALKQQLGSFFEAQQHQQIQSKIERFDSALPELDPDVFGKGSYHEVTSSQQAMREAAWNAFNAFQRAMPSKSDEELMRMVTRGFSNTPKPTAAPLVRKRAAQVQGGDPGPKSKESRWEEYKRINQRINAAIAGDS